MKKIFEQDHPDKCTFESCNYEKYKDKDKCIFHCEKDEWYNTVINKVVWDRSKVAEFWKEIREFVATKKHYNFHDIVFPDFEKKSEYLMPDPGTLSKDYNFWEKGAKTNDLKIEQSITFRDCIFLGHVRLRNVSILNNISFEACNFYGDVSLCESDFYGNVTFSFCTVEKRLFIVDSRFHGDQAEIKFYDVSLNNRFVMREINSDNLKFNIKLVHFYENSISDIAIVKLKEFRIDSLYNFSKNFQIRELEVKNIFSIENSTLSNIIFLNCPFNTTDKLIFMNVSLNNIRFDNIDWGKIDSQHFQADRDAIRQLKQANDQQGNYIQANKFYALEMEKYSEEIKHSKNYLEKTVFLISKKISNFSQDWALPVFWYLFVASLIYDYLLLNNISFKCDERFILIILSLYLIKILVAIKIILSDSKKWINLAYVFLVFQAVFVTVFDIGNNIIGKYLWIFDPVNTKSEGGLIENLVFIGFKLFTILIGYHLVTALRFHTRRK